MALLGLGHGAVALQIVMGRSDHANLRGIALMAPLAICLLSFLAITILGWGRTRVLRGWPPFLTLLALLSLAVGVPPEGADSHDHAAASAVGFVLVSLALIVGLVPREVPPPSEYEEVFE